MAGTETERMRPVSADAALIAADVGGTHARLAVVVPAAQGGGLVAAQFRRYACADHASLAAIVDDYRTSIATVDGEPVSDRLALAIAGYVVDDAVVNPSLPWPVSVSGLRRQLDLGDLAVVNDFEAAAHGAGHVLPDAGQLLCGPTHAVSGPMLVVGPGTGLGAAVRVPHAHGVAVLATEVGQATLAPDSELEIELLRVLRRQGGRVLVEHVISGPGLVNLHGAMCEVRDRPQPALSAAQITAAAADDSDAIAVETVEVFCGWLGSVLGDLALSYGASGGILVIGGVLPPMRDLLARSRFVDRFLDKHPMRAALQRIPVRLLDDPQLGVVGAAAWYRARDAARIAGAA